MNPFKSQPRPKVIERVQDSSMHLFVGPMPKGPKRCFKCRKPFRPGEAWRRYTSPADPVHGAYSIGIHEKCVRK
jgi:hypothetical protein